jgi:hypothetical protein
VDTAEASPEGGIARFQEVAERMLGSQSFLRTLVVLGVGAGALFRVATYMRQRSFWVDEAMLALNVVTRGFVELAQPLDLLQSAPLGFLWLGKAITTVAGTSELAFRLPGLVAGVLFLPLIAWLLWREVSPAAAVVGTAICASSGLLEHYSNEFKPYGLDALMSLLLLVAALQLRRPHAGKTALRTGAVLAVIAPLVSLPSVFVVGSIGLVALLHARGSAARRNLLIIAALGVVSSIGSVLVIHDPRVVEPMKDYWEGAFLGTEGDPARHVNVVRSIFYWILMGRAAAVGTGAEAYFPWIALVLWLLGVVSFARRDRDVAMLIAMPIVAGCVASAARQYPFAMRLWLFAVPLLVLGMVEGMHFAMRWVSERRRELAVLALGGLLWIPGGRFAVYEFREPRAPPEHARPVLAELAGVRRGEPLYVYARALPAFLFYSRDVYEPAALRQLIAQGSPPDGPFFMNGPAPILLGALADSTADRETSRGTDLFGTGTGFHNTIRGERPPVIDAAWLEQESGRIERRAGSACAWTFEAHAFSEEIDALDGALSARGFSPSDRLGPSSARAKRWCRGGAPALRP